MRHVQPRELELSRRLGHLELLQEPVVQRTVVDELDRAERVRDALERVGLPVRPVVGRVDLPGVPRPVVLGLQDAVHDGVAHLQVGVRHVDLGAQGAAALLELAGAHAREQVEVLLDRAVAVGARRPGHAGAAALLAHLGERQVAHVGGALLDQAPGELVQILEVVRGVEEPVLPVEAEPADVLQHGVDELDVLGDGVGIVEAQVALAAVLLRQAEVDADRLGVADVEEAVRLRREARVHAGPSGGDVRLDDLFDEVEVLFGHRRSPRNGGA